MQPTNQRKACTGSGEAHAVLWTLKQDEASPCEVQENQANNMGIQVFPDVIKSGPHPDVKHRRAINGKAVKQWAFSKKILSLLFA